MMLHTLGTLLHGTLVLGTLVLGTLVLGMARHRYIGQVDILG